MNTILPCAQALLYTLRGLMPSPYQALSLKAVLAMFWEPQRVVLPAQCVIKSAAALSRFLNEYGWPTRAVIQATRKQIVKELLTYAPRGKRPHLQVIIDLTTLEKRGKFQAFNWLIHILNHKRGLHLVVMYLIVGQWRVPWAFRPWRGKNTLTPAQLGLRLLRTLPKQLQRRFRVQVLAATGYTRVEFLNGVKKLRDQAIVGLASFGQQTLLGVYRWLILSLISFVLTHCWAGDPPSRVYLSSSCANLPDWKEATLLRLELLMPKTAVSLLLIEIESKRELLASQGLAVELVSIQI